ncbi:hypothetical protein X748_15820 [Mesorhizobium sp. LNJC386A00]|nr:hypothetical protein X748_15820 [Mesorhizobium sp. LNJC386A00]
MPEYQVEEWHGEECVSTQATSADDPLSAVEKVTGQRVSPRALQEHWFRVVDEDARSTHEFSLEDGGAAGDFAK